MKKKFGILFEKKIEISELSEITTTNLIQLLHSDDEQNPANQSPTKSQFAKPKAPGAGTRGPRRLLKTPEDQ